ncbi:IS110 family transposase [Phaeobacter piscinae]|uniref:IS110 family transposase n=1 Tax=Phaeobacter piscinae TaxID=1580596 RepID=UPI000BBE8B6E|nr:IS110 family transposase [Phaeobacter piscinae]ATG41757.1 Transposase IS116/IS110/IS902 family protein [Phaeobacter piscinae]AUR38180.1 Transposase IS116/IS110/IS902 family protein [Phaeobacter piscinae]
MTKSIGIDVSKETLDAHRTDDGAHAQFQNDSKGRRALLRWIGDKVSLVVFEATGAYHRGLELDLAGASVPFAKVNPKQARRFAQAIGKLAKTDRVDAAMLAKMGAVLDLSPQTPATPELHDMRELLAARRALIKNQTAARTRLATASVGSVQTILKRRLKQIVKDIDQIDDALRNLSGRDMTFARKVAILASIPGIGQLTAITLLIDMPEIGGMDNKQAASLAGLAPVSQSSGKWQGKERIQGGRAQLRKALYMPALVATRVNPDMTRKYNQLIEAGKEKKVALTAIMRKLLVMANALLRSNRMWTKARP